MKVHNAGFSLLGGGGWGNPTSRQNLAPPPPPPPRKIFILPSKRVNARKVNAN